MLQWLYPTDKRYHPNKYANYKSYDFLDIVNLYEIDKTKGICNYSAYGQKNIVINN